MTDIRDRAPRVVIVDDDADILDVLTLLFTEEGFDTAGCQTAEAALESLRAVPADLLITDLRLNEVSGLDLVRDTQRISGLPPRIILLTAAREPELETDPLLLEVGARIITKPFDIDQLIDSAREMTGRSDSVTL